MAQKEVTPEMVDGVLDNIIEVAEQMRLEHLQHSSEARLKEAETLRLEKETLQKKLGADHPRVKALENASRSAELLAEFAKVTRNHAEQCKDVKYGGK